MTTASSLRNVAPASRQPVYFRSSSESLGIQVATAAAAADVTLVTEIPVQSGVAAILISIESLDRYPPRHRGVPTMLLGPESEEAEMWAAATSTGIDHVVPLPRASAWLAEFLGALHRVPERANLIAILGGCGGAGASTLSCLIAAAGARKGARSLLIDADAWGSGSEGMLCADRVTGITWTDLAEAMSEKDI
ncbi:Mrp family chromosome partitioning ATPase [Psychromicrobium silvestre]|uniref:Mrp family chromosome partitioning ATPase n=1 Tax=Psychromicrobium silvestre TaxID=1645614 RepID=A0A7Y9S834_9MICC|nr:hypothetical protein [Psychromicrobium silvestre]NYE95586.1 Mrp family chromosome partitioning ATPase [Psychromicrobium silvestre]